MHPVALTPIIVVLGGVYYLAASFSAAARVAPRWIHFSGYARQRLFQCKTLSAGAMLGILFLLFASGDFLRQFRKGGPAA